MCFDFLYNFCLKHILFYEKFIELLSQKYTGLYRSTRYSCQILNKLELSRQIFEKSSNTICDENPSSGSRVFPCGRKDRQIDTTKLIVVCFWQFRERF
jgi:hypothetical protein